MAINFPNNPVENQLYIAEGTTWRWAGGAWAIVAQTGAQLLEFFDPTGAASWRIVGNTLECWGIATIADGDSTTFTFPKPFQSVPSVTVSSGSNAVGGQDNFTVTATQAAITANSFAVTARQGIATADNVRFQWYAVGEVADAYKQPNAVALDVNYPYYPLTGGVLNGDLYAIGDVSAVDLEANGNANMSIIADNTAHLWFRDADNNNRAIVYSVNTPGAELFRIRKYIGDGTTSKNITMYDDRIEIDAKLKFYSGTWIEWATGDSIAWHSGVGLMGTENGSDLWVLGTDIQSNRHLIAMGSRVYFGNTPNSSLPDYIQWITGGQGLLGYENGELGFRLSTGGNNYTIFRTVETMTTGSMANVFVGSGGSLMRSTSTGKYKTDVRTLSTGMDIVNALRPTLFKSLHEGDDKERDFLGFIAEEVLEVLPSSKVDNENYDVRSIVAALVDAVQHLNTEVQRLSTELEVLRNESA